MLAVGLNAHQNPPGVILCQCLHHEEKQVVTNTSFKRAASSLLRVQEFINLTEKILNCSACYLNDQSNIGIIHSTSWYIWCNENQSFWLLEFIWDTGTVELRFSRMHLPDIQFHLSQKEKHKGCYHCSCTENNNLTRNSEIICQGNQLIQKY